MDAPYYNEKISEKMTRIDAQRQRDEKIIRSTFVYERKYIIYVPSIMFLAVFDNDSIKSSHKPNFSYDF